MSVVLWLAAVLCAAVALVCVGARCRVQPTSKSMVGLVLVQHTAVGVMLAMLGAAVWSIA